MSLQNVPEVRAQSLIRKPVAEVYAAFVDPAVTTHFWFTKSSGKLEPGAKVRWEWEMYGASAEVTVEALEPNERIAISWSGPAPKVEWTFTERAEGTVVVVTNSGFSKEESAVAEAINSMGGFTSMLAGAKAWLEHGIELNLVRDHHPEAWR
jgi:uncharacterized protein YndB with AHSA1/START domain